jgi:hypothetical protein
MTWAFVIIIIIIIIITDIVSAVILSQNTDWLWKVEYVHVYRNERTMH